MIIPCKIMQEKKVPCVLCQHLIFKLKNGFVDLFLKKQNALGAKLEQENNMGGKIGIIKKVWGKIRV